MGADIASLRAASERLEALLVELEHGADEKERERAREVVQLLMLLHREALERALALAADTALGGAALVDRLADDPCIGPLLLVHGLHPHRAEVRLARALDRLRPIVTASGCRATLAALEGEMARVRIEGGARLANPVELTSRVEASLLEAAPELTAVVFELAEAAVAAPARPLIQIQKRPASAERAEVER